MITVTQMSVLLKVQDMDQALAFYREKLGFQVDFRYQDFYAGISKDGYSIHLKLGAMQEEYTEKTNDDLHVLFKVANIEGVNELLIKKGVRFIQPLRQMDYGKEFYIADPWDNRIGFIE